ncbi:hypothetical protein SBF1_2470015 [Candidatus Desulfosporosinus infrequens]|uniref:Uncharacterized protein n=1 Tax=Candidatus Desulfosporosinus infrequens TaxID=2043169 RepID=A0A2U3KNV2_9FIRM|nr:hypothetical protein SBF1_2470015 [Candidatus Desulfosporosinus infrequens]
MRLVPLSQLFLVGLNSNKVNSKDAWSNLSYMVSRFVFGLASLIYGCI